MADVDDDDGADEMELVAASSDDAEGASATPKPKKKRASKAAKSAGDEGEKEVGGVRCPCPGSAKAASADGPPTALYLPRAWRRQAKGEPFDPAEIASLLRQYPPELPEAVPQDLMDFVTSATPLTLQSVSITDHGPVSAMRLSYNAELLATFCTLGHIKIWETDSWQLVQQLRDAQEANIDEYYCGAFLPDGRHLIAGGKLKDRKRWSVQDEDNHILPCPLKLFDIATGEVLDRFAGHDEEILCVELCRFKGQSYLLTSSQDGHIIKWHMSDDFRHVTTLTKMADKKTCMAFMVAFVPNTGNRYFLGACDENVRLYDFEHAQLLQSFNVKFSSYCDFVQFVTPRHLPAQANTAYFVTRGVELLGEDSDAGVSKPNSCALYRLNVPTRKNARFSVEEVQRFEDAEYHSNSWLIKLACNGRVLAAPTVNGRVVLFSLETGKPVAVLRDHEDREVRDVVFHPTKQLLLTCGDDGHIKLYRPGPPPAPAAAAAASDAAVAVADDNDVRRSRRRRDGD